MTTPNIYIPKISPPLTNSPQIRLLLLGESKSGKTYSTVTTFPNPVVADWDNGLTSPAYRDVPNLVKLPFYADDWCKVAFPGVPNSIMAFRHFLLNDARKLTSEQTLIWDSLSAWQERFQAIIEPTAPMELGKDGKMHKNGFWFWGEKLKHMAELHGLLFQLKCNIVTTAHIQDEKDPTGVLTGKSHVLVSGQFAKNIGSKYTDVLLALAGEEKTKDAAGLLIPTGKRVYYWQTQSDDRFDLGGRMTFPEKFVKPGYQNFQYGSNHVGKITETKTN